MRDTEIVNAVIKGTSLGYEDHGILTAWLHLDYGGSQQGFGGYALDSAPDKDDKSMGRKPHAAFGAFVKEILAVTDAHSWEKIPGKFVRVKREAGFTGDIIAIGHPLKDIWFDPKAVMRGLA